MASIRASLRRTCDEIRDNRSLDERGRKREIAKVVLAHRKKAAALREDFNATGKARRKELEMRLFGLPEGGDSLSYRNAIDRAEAIKSPLAAEALLAQAQGTGDTLLGRAVARYAASKGWWDIAGTYAAEAGHSLALDELSGMGSRTQDALGEAALFAVPNPPELGGLRADDSTLERFIEETASVL